VNCVGHLYIMDSCPISQFFFGADVSKPNSPTHTAALLPSFHALHNLNITAVCSVSFL